MKKIPVYLFAFVLCSCRQDLVSFESFPDEGYGFKTAPAQVSIKDSVFKISNQTITQIPLKENNSIVFYSNQILSKKVSGEIISSAFNVQAAAFSMPKNAKTLWEKTISATKIEYEKDFLKAITEAKSNFEQALQIIHAENGETVLYATDNVEQIVVPNSTEKRFLGFVSRLHPERITQKEGGKCIGVLYYASAQKTIQKIHFYAVSDSLANGIQEISPSVILASLNPQNISTDDGRGLVLMSAKNNSNTNAISDFQIELTFWVDNLGEERKIVLPIVEDKIVLEKIQLDKKVFEVK